MTYLLESGTEMCKNTDEVVKKKENDIYFEKTRFFLV